MATIAPNREGFAEVPSSRSGFIAPLRSVEWRESGAGSGEYTFTGLAAVFNSWSEELWTRSGSFRERILPGAFDDVLARKPDVKLLVNHDENLVLARTKSGTLELTADGEALRVWARVAPTSYATDLRMSMERGDIDQMSFMFDFDPDSGAEDRWYQGRNGETLRDVVKVSDLLDVTVSVFPAYLDTQAAMRSMRAAQRKGEIASNVDSVAARQRYQRILQVVTETPWAMLPQSLAMLMRLLEAHAAGERVPEHEVQEAFRSSEREERPRLGGAVAVIPIYGPIFPRANLMTDMSGATDLGDVRAAFRTALADDEVSAVLLDVDSPGGVVSGVPEFAAEVRAARGQKPIVALANTLAASAAHWIASAADEFVASPSAEVGSIGVWTAHTDFSRSDEMKGIKTTLISAGKFKTEGNPYEPLSDEARDAIQADVDVFYDMFVADVAKDRGLKPSQVRSGFGEGRTVVAKAALKEGMIDRIETFEQVVARLSRTPTRRTRRPTDVLDLPEDAFATREALRSAFGLAASAERDPTGRASSRGAPAEGDRASDAPAEIDPVVADGDALTGLKARKRAEAEQARLEALRAIGAATASPSRKQGES